MTVMRTGPASACSRSALIRLSPATVSLATTRTWRTSVSDPFQLAGLDAGSIPVEDRVPCAHHAVLVRCADDLRDLVEVEDRRRRGDLPLDRVGAPGVALGARAEAPADDHVVEE